MRPLVLSIGILSLVLGVAWSQTSDDGTKSGPQLPVGQTFKNFVFPVYQQGVLKATLNAVEATGITQNRAATSDLKIQLYEENAVTTTITSPQADLYVNDRIMRTKNTVRVERSDMVATSQTCDFDMITKKYIMRNNVKVVLKNFDAGSSLSAPGSSTPSPAHAAAQSQPTPPPPPRDDSLLDTPGAYSNTNSIPLFPKSPDTK